ncbi:MarR family winged helix-turn-helix transcriptional regulator [uncultured Roseobacter sp.]|uniref:MarR family winged helix-turn-helix transcriptional regulator n=1 Tax=uncultured Roseobacter sp. TaxID=114847 RepID=UPI0026288166|nr:MarR family winged helix-turn-helix transcriptional regulator [uncultured Roseobacter sp.]
MPSDSTFDLQAFLPYLLTQAAERSSLEFHQVYKDRYGLLRTEWRVLFHLGLYGSMTAGAIGTAAQTHKTKISRAVHRLAEKRYITRNRDEKDRRVEHLDLTPRGRSVFNELRGIAADYDDALNAQLSPQELEVLRTALRKLGGSDGGPFT